MTKGEVWIVEIPDLSGHEQSGLRPAIFIADTRTSIAIVIPCTANLQALLFPFTIQIAPSRINGLDVSTIALVLQLRAIDKKRLQKKVGKLEKPTLQKIEKMLRNLLEL